MLNPQVLDAVQETTDWVQMTLALVPIEKSWLSWTCLFMNHSVP